MEFKQKVKRNNEWRTNLECGVRERENDNRIWRVRLKARNGREILGRGLGS